MKQDSVRQTGHCLFSCLKMKRTIDLLSFPFLRFFPVRKEIRLKKIKMNAPAFSGLTEQVKYRNLKETGLKPKTRLQ